MQSIVARPSKPIRISTGGSSFLVTAPRHTNDPPVASADVTASEIACFAYCAKAWHIEHVLRLAPSRETAERREAGIADHEIHGQRLHLLNRLVRRRRPLVAALLALALVAAAAALLT